MKRSNGKGAGSKPVSPVTIKRYEAPPRVGKRTREWLAFRRQYLSGRRNHEGYYVCPGCDRWVDAVELDHIVKRSLAPERRLDEGNVRMLCSSCHRRRHERESRPAARLEDIPW